MLTPKCNLFNLFSFIFIIYKALFTTHCPRAQNGTPLNGLPNRVGILIMIHGRAVFNIVRQWFHWPSMRNARGRVEFDGSQRGALNLKLWFEVLLLTSFQSKRVIFDPMRRLSPNSLSWPVLVICMFICWMAEFKQKLKTNSSNEIFRRKIIIHFQDHGWIIFGVSAMGKIN